MKEKMKRVITIIMAVVVMFVAANPTNIEAASKKVKLNKTSITLTITNKKASPSAALKVKNTSKAVKWTTSNKKVATVQKTGKYKIKIVAKKAGKATITCKVNGKKLTCKVTVVDKRTTTNTGSGNNTGTSGTTGTAGTTETTGTTGTTGTTETTGTTGTTASTGDSENTNSTSEKKPIGRYICGTQLKTGGGCGWYVDVYVGGDADEEANKALTEHLLAHLMNGEIPQYTTRSY